MLRLHYSNRFEELVAPLGAAVHQAQSDAPLERVTIVVPGRVVEEFLKLRLAESEGVAANLHFPFLRRYLDDVVEAATSGLRVIELDELQIVAFEYLRKAMAAADPDFRAVEAYVGGSPDRPRQREEKLFQLSARVAWLFREYSINRRPMLARWSQEGGAGVDAIDPNERWQRRLYTGLFDRDGRLKSEWTDVGQQPASKSCWMMLPDAFATAEPERLLKSLPRVLHVFGLGYAGPEFLKIFALLGGLIDLEIYALNPCQEFWEDVQDARTARAVSRPPRIGAALMQSEDPFGLESAGDNLALRQWGRVGREYIRLLNELSDCDFEAHFRDPAVAGQPGSLLAQVQRMILLRQPETALPIHEASNDGSIRFLLCPGVRREVEIVANSIWSLIRADGASEAGSGQRLRFHQIAVVMPDSLRESYLPHIESVFAQAHALPLNLVDRRWTAANRVAEAVELLLRLPLGRFSRNEVTRLLTHPVFAGALPEESVERWMGWCRSLGVYFGADESAFADSYVPPTLYHWDQALKRMALGHFMERGTRGNRSIFDAGDRRDYLPYEVAEDAAEAAAAMVQTVRRLLCDAQEIASCDLPLTEWSRVLGDLVAKYIQPQDRVGERVRDLIMRSIDSMAPAGLVSGPVSYAIAAELALARIATAESEHVAYAENGVVVGSLSALRAIPFRVVFMIGMGELHFPERERRDPIDLRLLRRSPGDVSAAERDRYMFLETLIAARERIFLSYVARNAQTGDRLELSPVVRDLQLILRKLIAADDLQSLSVEHPLSSYDRSYFRDLRTSGDDRPAIETFDRSARRGAQIAGMRDDLEARCGPLSAANEESLLENLRPEVRTEIGRRLRMVELPEVSSQSATRDLVLPLAALRHYLECPLQGAARYALGLFEEEEGDEEDADEEPLDQSHLDRAILLREVLWRARGREEEIAKTYRSEFRLQEMSGAAPTGPFALAAEGRDLAKLTLTLEQMAIAGVKNLEGWQQIAIGGANEFIGVDCTLPELVLEVDAPRPDGTTIHEVTLRGWMGPVSPGRDRAIRCIAGKEAKAKDFLEGFLGAIVLAAAGKKMPSSFTVFAVGGEDDGSKLTKFSRSFQPPTANAARSYLAALVKDLLADANAYFLPIEAVEKILKVDVADDRVIKEAIDSICDNEFARCRSDFGPVADARNFPPCAPALARDVIGRRFELLKAIFGK